MSDDKQPLVGTHSPSAPPLAPPPYTPPGGGYGAPAHQPPAPGYAQGTTTVVHAVVQPRPVHSVGMVIKPPNYIVLSTLNMLFCCFLFGLLALVMGIQSDSAWARGDHDEAHRLSMVARRWNIIGVVGGFFFTAAWVIAVIAASVSTSININTK